MRSTLFAVTLLVALFAVVAIEARHHKLDGLRRGLAYRGIKPTGDGPEAQWFEQPVDNFDPENNGKWKQRYFVNDTYWKKPQGPILYLLGGEGPIAPDDVTGHFVLNDYAQKFGALIVSVEHRFYGESMPTSDLSTKNLKYLNSLQALADYARFRQHIVKEYNCPKSKWIVFGGSYSGALSAWFRLKYPHLVVGSLATSAPVKAQEDFSQYFQVVATSVGPQCEQRLVDANTAISRLLTNAAGKKQLKETFSLCSDIETGEDIAMFWNSISGAVSEIVQYSNDNNNYLPFNVSVMCSILQSGGSTADDAVKALANFNDQFNKHNNQKCTPTSYRQYVQELRDENPKNENAASRTWTWQTCIEFGYFQTSSASGQPFPPQQSLEWYEKLCKDVYEHEYLPNIDWINTVYGSTGIQSSNIIFPNGAVDPWHMLGVLNTTVSTMPAYFMQGTAHCADLYPPRATDLPQLTQTRKQTMQWFTTWLGN